MTSTDRLTTLRAVILRRLAEVEQSEHHADLTDDRPNG